MIYLKYLKSLLRHKWFVFVEACKLGIPWLGIIHDMSKFSPSEFVPYARNFYGDYPDNSEVPQILRQCYSWTGKTKQDTARDFDIAWLHHQKRNRHHWQYWLLQYGNSRRYSIQSWSDCHRNMIAIDNTPTLYVEHLETKADGESLWSMSYRVLSPLIKDANLAPRALAMPDKYRREMLADWRAVGKLYGPGDAKEWYSKNRDNIILHTETRAWIERGLGLAE